MQQSEPCPNNSHWPVTQPAFWPSLDTVNTYSLSLYLCMVLQQKLQQNIRLVWPCRGYYWGCCLTKIQDLTKFASCTLLYVVSQILYPAGTCTCSQGKYYLITIIDNNYYSKSLKWI